MRLGVGWVALSACLPAWLLASGLLAMGMTGAETLGAILLGNVIALVTAALIGQAGSQYGIPSSVAMRSSFGVVGAAVPAVVQSLVSCGWFGVQCWVGGQAVFAMLRLLAPGIGGSAIWYCFAAFWLVNVLLATIEFEWTRMVEAASAVLLLLVEMVLLSWAVGKADGAAVVLTALRARAVAEPQVLAPHWSLFVLAITAVVGFWGVMILRAADRTRWANVRAGQAELGLLPVMTLYAVVGVAVTAATVVFMPRHAPVWNPVELIAGIRQPATALVILAALTLGTLGVNLTTNVPGPATIFSGLRPNLISCRLGGLLVGLIGLVTMPWVWLADPARYIDGWLVCTSGLLGPIAGVMLADYFVVRRRSLDVEGLYVRGGQYEYASGFNVSALRAMAAGMIVAQAGHFFVRLHWLYACAWFVGLGVAGVVYLLLMSGPAETAEIPPTPLLIPLQGLEGEGA